MSIDVSSAAAHSIGFVGFGEVGKIFAADLAADGHHVYAYDRKIGVDQHPDGAAMREFAGAHNIVVVDTFAELATSATVIISVVTASETSAVAHALAEVAEPHHVVVDCNSASPGTKIASASAIEASGAKYVEVAIMTSVPPHRRAVPMLLGGPHATVASSLLASLGFQTEVASEELGVASATKMARSIMIKGLEAMVVESFATARALGVEDQVVQSLAETFPGLDWEAQATYFFQRTIAHGRRRAEEMREVAQTVREAGLHPWSSDAAAYRQEYIADLAADGAFATDDGSASSWRANADRLLGAQPITPGWLAFHPTPSTPTFVVPPGSVDAHCHVFGPSRQFPFVPTRKYTPCDAGADQLFALRDQLGFDRNVIVQATCHGADNRALLNTLRRAEGRARGVVTLAENVTDAELVAMHRAGVRGARFNFVTRLVDVTPQPVLAGIARRIAPFGWHIVVYFEAADLPGLESFFASLPTPVVVDHMGRPNVAAGHDGPEFARFVRFMDDNPHVWSKVTCPERLTVSGPPATTGATLPYVDVVPFARTIVERFPDRVLWGTDWPHPNLTDHMPDDGLLVDVIPRIATTPDLQRRLLVDNPTRLYWGD
jgi:2-pyrone-4,6-dicarboxylate lactonase